MDESQGSCLTSYLRVPAMSTASRMVPGWPSIQARTPMASSSMAIRDRLMLIHSNAVMPLPMFAGLGCHEIAHSSRCCHMAAAADARHPPGTSR